MTSTITLLNKISGKDTQNHLDIWNKTTISNVEWKIETVSAVDKKGVIIGEKYIVLLPFDKRYVDYEDYLTDQTDRYTVSTGDYVVFGEITDDVTCDNVVDVLENSRCRVCKIMAYVTAIEKYGTKVQVRIEGV